MRKGGRILGLESRVLQGALLALTLGLAAGVSSASEAPTATRPTGSVQGRMPNGGGVGQMPAGSDDGITPERRAAMWDRIRDNLARLPPQAAPTGKANKKAQPTLAWPLLAGPHLSDPDYHGISNFVDHNPAYPNQLTDYTCSDRTYDVDNGYNHAGTDIFTWPFSWLKMSRDDVQIVAAANGRIIDKYDGNPDQSCVAAGGDWNAVYVQQDDGSILWYGHMKKFSQTSKAVGDKVMAGEFLGVVGSSGDSNGPHLHMELYDAGGNLADPFDGSCNALTLPWWKSQPDYRDSKINQVTVGYAMADFPDCPGIESPNVRDSFNGGDTIYLTTYYHDQVAGQVSDYVVTQPDGTVYSSFSHSLSVTYNASYVYWYFALPADAQTGTWKFSVTYQGGTVDRYFNLGDPTMVKVKVPAGGEVYARGDTVQLKWKSNIGGGLRVELWSKTAFVATLLRSTPNDGKAKWKIPTDLPPGKYLIKLIDLGDESVTGASNKAFTVQ